MIKRIAITVTLALSAILGSAGFAAAKDITWGG